MKKKSKKIKKKKEIKKIKIKKKTKKSKVKKKRKLKKVKHKIKERKIKKKKEIKKKVKIKIKKIKKAKISPRAASGITGFDKMTQGGFERNSINLIVGGSGSGKSILALQFLIEGLKKNEPGLYVTFEEKKSEFYDNMKKFGWDLEKLEKTGKFFFIEYSPEKVKMMLDEGGGAIESLVLKNQIKRLVIDSITSFTLLFDDPVSKRQASLGLFDIISKWNLTTLLTVQQDPAKAKKEAISVLEFETDSITLLYYMKIKGKRKRFIEVLKMRGTNHSKDTHVFEIKKGISVGRKFNLKGFV